MTPLSWVDALEIDTAIRADGPRKGWRENQFMHRSLKPLAEAPIDEPETGQIDLFGFMNECEGMCGV